MVLVEWNGEVYDGNMSVSDFNEILKSRIKNQSDFCIDATKMRRLPYNPMFRVYEDNSQDYAQSLIDEVSIELQGGYWDDL